MLAEGCGDSVGRSVARVIVSQEGRRKRMSFKDSCCKSASGLVRGRKGAKAGGHKSLECLMLCRRVVKGYLCGRARLDDNHAVGGIGLYAVTVMGISYILSCETVTCIRLDGTHCPAATWSNSTKLRSSMNVGATSAEEASGAIVKIQPFG